MRSALSHFVWGYGFKYALELVAFVSGGFALYFHRWQKRRRENLAQGWPSVQGVVVSAKVQPLPQTKHFHAILQYTFFVDEYRTGKYVHEFSNEDDADEFVRQLKDKRLQIRYKQSNPDESVLEQSVVEQYVMLTPRFG